MNWPLHSDIKRGYDDKSGLEGPQRGKQLQMCKERNILRGWHRTKNAHSSHRPLEMECYQTGDYAPSINRYPNIH